MTQIIRPGHVDFQRAIRYCPPRIEEHILENKTQRVAFPNGEVIVEVLLGFKIDGCSVVLGIPRDRFPQFYSYEPRDQTWNKRAVYPERGPVDGPVMTPNEAKKIRIDSNDPEFNKILATMTLPSDWMKSEVVKEYDQYSAGIEPYLNAKYARGGQISSGTITNDKLTTGYGATETRHFSEIYNELIKQNQAEHWSIPPTKILKDMGIPMPKAVEDYCNADVEFTKEYYLTEEKKEMNNVVDNKLYLVIGEGPHKGKYVTKIAINKANEFVVEAKGENAYFSVKEADLERVLPYSVDVRFMAPNGAALNGRVYSYWSNPGDVAVGDVIFAAEYGNPMIVVAVDTKAESATKFLTGSVMKPAKVLEGK